MTNPKDDQSRAELLPCPFCGGEAKILHNVFYTVTCEKCGAGINTARNQDYKAAGVWNTRATTSDAVRELVDALMAIKTKSELALRGIDNKHDTKMRLNYISGKCSRTQSRINGESNGK